MLLHQYQPLYKSTPVCQLMYLEVLLTNHRMEDNLKTHLEEVHIEEIHLEDHHSNHIESYKIKPMSKTLIRMLTSKYSKKPLKLTMK
jgi:hypothetical protein